ncbi:MAG: Inositol monophosphatase [Candidatus Uhrbacteria bacterium GW2011_GWA2_52_8d]|uniref:Inositol monophosphatase n=1 Tax=Candidatus Uhrbacteria bacterium GW2011_GWA2_52_8d TaxID=1618979 RepID=A0A0G1XK45_9BACT|nr:MAG: Inositol monophosphatase [Candidatus Uhrbacteria bacterium GW2011_GWA2_52_8d]
MKLKQKKDFQRFAEKLATQAGEIIMRYFDTEITKRLKEGEEVVTIADEKINNMVIKEVERTYPTHSVLGEEASNDKQSDLVWVCDPIDGTIPFTQGVPVSTFSLALVEDGMPIVGVVYDPYTKRLYSGAKELGAHVNSKRLQVSDRKLNNKQTTIDVEWWPQAEFNLGLFAYNLAMETGAYVPVLGSTVNASCYVGYGTYEACLFAGSKGKCVDIAAIKILVEEAGGKVTDLFGNEQRYDQDIKGAIVSNGVIHDEIVRRLKPYLSK